jgi:dihydrofolate reductase
VKTTVYCASSLDGFIARADGGIDWLGDPTKPGEQDYGFHAFFDSVDVLVLGRNSYDVVKDFDPWPYGSKPVVVLTSRGLQIPDRIAATVSTLSASPAEVIARLASQGARHLYIDGGKTVQSFLRAGMIDRLIITRVPILLGNGIPLFGPLEKDIRLKHVSSKTFPDGLEQSEYAVL